MMILLATNVFSQTKDEIIDQLITQLEESTSIIEELRNENQELRDNSQELVSQLEESTSIIEELRNENQELKNQLNNTDVTIPEDHTEQIEILLERLEDSNDTIIELRDRVEKDQEEIEGLRETINELIPMVDDTTFGIGAIYNYPHGINLIGEFKIPSFPISLIGNTGYFINNNLIYFGGGVKFSF